MKQRPEAYASLLRKKRESKIKRFEKLDEKSKAEVRLKHSKSTINHERRKREKDPSYRKYDVRTEIRKRVREGTATEEDKRKYSEICQKNKTSKQKIRSAIKTKAQEPKSLIDGDERTRKKRRTFKSLNNL